jgi:tripartite-type tricarboxylate transporter receptor subunit TctC
VAHLTGYTLGVVVAANAPWKTLPEMLAAAKAAPGKVSYGTPGAGSVAHVTMARLAKEQELTLTHVPFRGGSEAYAALLGGHVQAAADASGFGPMVEAGQLRLLAVWGKARAKRWPDVPTLNELGYAITAESPFGVAGPKNMDPAVVAVLAKAFQESLADPAVVAVLDRLDMRADPMGPADYAAFVRTQIADERVTLEAAGMLKK